MLRKIISAFEHLNIVMVQLIIHVFLPFYNIIQPVIMLPFEKTSPLVGWPVAQKRPIKEI